MDLLKQCAQWYENEEFTKIIDTLGSLLPEEHTRDTDMWLVRAYTHQAKTDAGEERTPDSGMLRKAIRIAELHREVSAEDYEWNLCMGSAYYYLDRQETALSYFQKALEVRAGDEAALFFIGKCMDFLSFPCFRRSFRKRTAEAWQAFAEREAELRGLIDRRGQEENREVLRQKCREILCLALENPSFELGFNGEKYELMLSPDEDSVMLYALLYFRQFAPHEIWEHWDILIGRQPEQEIVLRLGDSMISGGEVSVWFEKTEDGGLSLLQYCGRLEKLQQTDHDRAQWLLYLLTNQALGEAFCMNYIRSVDILDAPKEAPAVLLSELSRALEREGFPLSGSEDCRPPEQISYEQDPSREEDAPRRTDIFSGVTSCPLLISDYWGKDLTGMNALHAQGAVAGFFFFAYPFSDPDKKDNAEERTELYHRIVSGLEESLGEEILTGIGSAVGLHYGYFDFIAWDLPAVLAQAEVLFSCCGVPFAFFQSFRADVAPVSVLKPAHEAEGTARNGAEEGDGPRSAAAGGIAMYDEKERDIVAAYIEKHFGEAFHVYHEMDPAGIYVDLWEIDPTEEKNYYTLVTMGMGAHRMRVPEDSSDGSPERAELVISLPADWRLDPDSMQEKKWYWPLRLMKDLARLPLDDDTWIGWGETMENREPFAENTALHGLILVNAVDGTDGACVLPDGEEVRFYQILPLYREEMDYKLNNNAEALLEKLRDVGPVVSVDRPSVVEAEPETGVNENASDREVYFTGRILLSKREWDKAQFILDMREKWGINAVEDEEDMGIRDDSVVFRAGDMLASVKLVPKPVPDGEAERRAERNDGWPEAGKIAGEHCAYLEAVVIDPQGTDLKERAKLCTKMMAACCRQRYAAGVDTGNVVFEPALFETLAERMKEDVLPVFNWIWFAVYRDEKGISACTYGMDRFGMEEMEILYTKAEPEDLRIFLADLASYVLENGIVLRGGETIGLTEEEQHLVTRSEGVALSGQMTLKISHTPVGDGPEAGSTEMDDAAYHLKTIRRKGLPVEEINAFSHMAVYLRWCMEQDLMGEDFLKKYGATVQRCRETPEQEDLRVFIRDELDGKLSATLFNEMGRRFAAYYYGDNDTPSFPGDIDGYALGRVGYERNYSDEIQDEAYLFLSFDETYYQDMARILRHRFAHWQELAVDESTRTPSKLARAFLSYVDCACIYFPSMSDDDPILSAYTYARRDGAREGSIPMLIKVDEVLWGNLIRNSVPDGKAAADYSLASKMVESYRREMLFAPVKDGKAVLADGLRRCRWWATEDSAERQEIIGEMKGGSPQERLTGHWRSKTGMTDPMILAKIPVRHPWEVFAYLPFGNWDECPDTPEMMAAAKYWFEQYLAIPAVLSHDMLEFVLSKPVPEEKAMEAALEIYGFCPDIVDQAAEDFTIGSLADQLRQSTVWRFRWS